MLNRYGTDSAAENVIRPRPQIRPIDPVEPVRIRVTIVHEPRQAQTAVTEETAIGIELVGEKLVQLRQVLRHAELERIFFVGNAVAVVVEIVQVGDLVAVEIIRLRGTGAGICAVVYLVLVRESVEVVIAQRVVSGLAGLDADDEVVRFENDDAVVEWRNPDGAGKNIGVTLRGNAERIAAEAADPVGLQAVEPAIRQQLHQVQIAAVMSGDQRALKLSAEIRRGVFGNAVRVGWPDGYSNVIKRIVEWQECRVGAVRVVRARRAEIGIRHVDQRGRDRRPVGRQRQARVSRFAGTVRIVDYRAEMGAPGGMRSYGVKAGIHIGADRRRMAAVNAAE